MSLQIKLEKFSMDKINQNPKFLIIGPRRCGKSLLVKDIFYYNKPIHKGIVFSKTEETTSFYRDFIPDISIHDDSTKSIKLANNFIVMEDVFDLKEIIKTNEQYIVTMQYPLKSALCSNFDYICIFNYTLESDRKKIY